MKNTTHPLRLLSLSIIATAFIYAQDIYATFNVQANQNADLAFTSTGIVDKLYVDVAQKVQKGQKLAELENSDLQSSVDVAKAELNLTQVALKFAKRAYDRETQVKKLISEQQHDQVIQAYDIAKTELALKKANLQFKESMLDKTILYAPFDGVIYDKALEIGDAVSGAMIRTVIKIHSIDDVKLLLEFDQKYWKDIQVGDIFEYQVDGDETIHKGTISKIYPFADSNNRKIKAEVEAKGFLPGLFGTGTIKTNSKEK